MDYILGLNPMKMSYMVGYGSKYLERVHHRGSSLSLVSQHPQAIGCSVGFQAPNSNSPNPNLLIGVVVGGPNCNDHFSDDINDYEQSSPSTYINAPLVGSLTYFDIP